MKKFIILTVLSIVAVAVSVAHGQSFSAAALDGNWRVTYLERDGAPVPEAAPENTGGSTRVRFKHDEVVEVVRTPEGARQLRLADNTVSVGLQAGWTGVASEFSFGNSDGHFTFRNGKLYMFVADEQARWALPPRMPTTLQTRAGDRMTLIVLERTYVAPITTTTAQLADLWLESFQEGLQGVNDDLAEKIKANQEAAHVVVARWLQQNPEAEELFRKDSEGDKDLDSNKAFELSVKLSKELQKQDWVKATL